MYNTLIIVITALLMGTNQNNTQEFTKTVNVVQEFQKDSTYLFKANPQKGFNFDYYIYFPPEFDSTKKQTLLIETNNTGLNDSISHHLKHAKYAASKSSVGNYVSKKLGIPLLVPVFPRSKTNWQVYTHALDSDTFNEKGTNLERLDLQLIAMFNDAKEKLHKKHINLQDKFFITGFSASGTFANRFSILHPTKIKAVCAGGLNSILIIPSEVSSHKNLKFPIGIYDVEKITGKKVNLKQFQKLPQFWFMGALDTNDAAKYDDGYTAQERSLIFDILGEEMMPKRWENIQKIYLDSNIHATFKTYPNIGHGTDIKINNEIAAFFKQYLN